VQQRGDTLSGIAQQRLGDGDRCPKIVELNGDLVSDPDRFFPDGVLTLPEDTC
jgi:nucleoid-associated protein YgaU